jgi:hypothetical protein
MVGRLTAHVHPPAVRLPVLPPVPPVQCHCPAQAHPDPGRSQGGPATPFTAHSTQHTVHSTQHTVHSTQYTAHSTQHTAHNYKYDRWLATSGDITTLYTNRDGSASNTKQASMGAAPAAGYQAACQSLSQSHQYCAPKQGKTPLLPLLTLNFTSAYPHPANVFCQGLSYLTIMWQTDHTLAPRPSPRAPSRTCTAMSPYVKLQTCRQSH